MASDSRTDVFCLIVGAGPVGLTAAKLLANGGAETLIVERRPGPLRHPAAHVVNARTLEIFRQAGVDMDAVHAIAADPADAGHVNFVTTLAGRSIGRLPFERQGPEVLELTPTPLRNISQHRLEPLLSADVDASADLRYGHEWVSSVQDDDGVTSVVRDLSSGADVEVRSQFVIAADGAGSPVRKSLGIEMVGPPALQSFVAMHFRADLRSLIAHRLGVLHFAMEPGAGGSFIAHDIDREWVYMASFDPTEETEDDFDATRCASMITRAIGDPATEIDETDLLSIGTWHMSAQLAERMRDRRIFLVGDAAHRFPPTGGLGLNTGVADAQCLVWRLLAVADGWAAASVLDSYETERRPVAGRNCEQSVANVMKMFSLVEALGITKDPSVEGVHAVLDDPATQPSIEAAVQEQATHFDMIGLQLGQWYPDGAVVHGDRLPSEIDDPRCFEPLALAGCRLPHAWLTDGRSTLDLVPPTSLVLLSFDEHDRWADALGAVFAPVRHVRVGVDVELPASPLWPVGRGALLVRPDQHIAWRADDDGAAIELGSVVHRLTQSPEQQPSLPQR